jgi:hypothetical protein
LATIGQAADLGLPAVGVLGQMLHVLQGSAMLTEVRHFVDAAGGVLHAPPANENWSRPCLIHEDRQGIR